MSNVKDLWQVFIISDTNQSIPITIDKNKSVKDLFKEFRAKQKTVKKEARLALLVVDGPELQEDDRTRLVDHDYLRDKCNIQLIMRVDGGGWPTQSDIEQQIRDPTKIKSLAGRITKELPDIMGLDDDTPRVKMSCDHAIAPSSLAIYCYTEIGAGAFEIKCPDPDCDTLWLFKSIIDAACLSPTETHEFELKMISNKLSDQSTNIKECPGCKNLCRRLNKDETRIRCRNCTSANGRNFDFCWSCLEQWQSRGSGGWCGNLKCGDHTKVFKTLSNCGTKDLNGVECPSMRACPKCLMLIEHTERCKHIKCPSKSCKYEFCFICLEHYPCKTAYDKPCALAPRQDASSLPPSHSPSQCAIL